MSDQVDRLDAIFHGEVQGVGFRYTTRNLAVKFPKITGIVRNLPDGTVHLLAEGDNTDITQLLQDIQSRMNEYITNIEQTWSSGPREYDRFGIGF